MPLARVNGVALYYEVHGQGPWLVLVHEFAGCYKSWQPQIDVLRAHYRVLVYNCRGYPPSTVPTDLADYSQDASIEDLSQLLDHLGIEQTALGGFSMGGSIALNFALSFPDRVRALILAGTGTGSADTQQFARDFSPIADRLERDGVKRVAEDYLRGPTRIQLLRKDPAMWRKFHADFVELSSLGLAHTLRGVQLRRPTMYELEAGLRTLQAPTLVIVGDEDAPATDASRFLAATIPGARLRVLAGTGHTLNLEEPTAFNDAVLQFLREVED